MSSRIGDRIAAARRRRFVGRTNERALFQNALTAPELPFQVLHIFGPGGIGKTTLLKEFAALADQIPIPAFFLDARNLEISPESFLSALHLAMGLAANDSPVETLAAQTTRSILLIDTLEMLASLDDWLREYFLPQLPEQTLVVMASRNAPSARWHAELGGMIQLLALANLNTDESRDYLTRRRVPSEQHAAVLDFTRGHPLALSLVADVFAQRPGFYFQPQEAPDVIRTLLEQFVQKVPSPAHRAALEACVLVRLTTESLLAEMLACQDAHELFEWLRDLSFIQSGPLGIFPHDLAREAVTTDLRWRNPDWHKELHKRARAYYIARLRQIYGNEQQQVLTDYIFLHRHNPVVRSLFQWNENLAVSTDTLRASDHAALIAMVARHEGTESARLAQHWLTRQPQNVQVYRNPDQSPAGWLMQLAVCDTCADDLHIDPSLRAATQYLTDQAPLRPGECATIFRFWMASDTYQCVSPLQSLIFVNIVRHHLTAPGLAFTFIPCAEPAQWADGFAYGDLARIPEADFEIGGRRYGIYGHDWRVTPPMTWLALMTERETNSDAVLAAPAPLTILSRQDFAEATRAALRDLLHADALRSNPLVRSRIVAAQNPALDTAANRATTLQTLLIETITSLQTSPRQTKLYRALDRTYLHPAPTQEHAAEILDLPFSTFRRHLKKGVDQVIEILWHQEIGR